MRSGSLLKRAAIGFAAALLTLPALAASPPPVAGRDGMVVTAQHLATSVGTDVLRKGGNAVDAAVAVGYALAVVYPQAGNIGGGGFMTVRLADGRTTFLDFREKAPLAAKANVFQDAKGNVVPGLSTDSWKAVGVPGTVMGLEQARTTYGTMSREALMAPAIKLAREGYVLGQGDAMAMSLEGQALGKDPAMRAIFLPAGKPLTKGDRLVQADLAATLSLISEKGPDAFYKGPIGAAIAEASKAGGGLMTVEDFAKYKVRELKPIECDYRGYHVISAPPPSSGGVTICQSLNILEGYDLKAMGFRSAAEVHVLAETLRRVFYDRNNKLGDPAFVKNPVAELLDLNYAAKLRAGIDLAKATPSASLGKATPEHEGRNTTHYSVLDKAGNAVAVTYTLNDWFGAHRVAGKTGIVMNNEMDDFTSKPGEPNMFGLVQGANNAVAPGKTPLSSMSPTILTKDGKPVLVIGSPGGSRIITITLLSILNMVDHGMDVQAAIDAPRIHMQWLPDQIEVEPFAVSADTRKLLEAKGHVVKELRPWGIAEGIVAGAPTLQTGGPVDPRVLALDGAPLAGATMFGAHDARQAGGLAEPVR